MIGECVSYACVGMANERPFVFHLSHFFMLGSIHYKVSEDAFSVTSLHSLVYPKVIPLL